ncbi:hypothetical protein N7530_009754 [Penicillium desertorum]|uniref:Uncharacterized protein n=1 Tax=Penicillium desertorum TaxID=1303715 RepID=A0A9W9WJP7_9EURO|nr:hypothetical protein N7530_009754 [Penicillium desertorum]
MADDGTQSWDIIPSWGETGITPRPTHPAQKRRRLIHWFLKHDEILEENVYLDEFPPPKPTSEEINIILQPWRSGNYLRRKAYYMSKDNVLVFLRTHYNPDDNDKMNEWVHENDLFEDTAWWACLNDPQLFDFDSDWQQVLHTKKQGGFRGWTEYRVKVTEESTNPLQNVPIAAYIVIADQEAFQTGLLRLFCLEDDRKIVWEARVDPKPAEIMKTYSPLGSSTRTKVFKMRLNRIMKHMSTSRHSAVET